MRDESFVKILPEGLVTAVGAGTEIRDKELKEEKRSVGPAHAPPFCFFSVPAAAILF
jgi:hypothetical protein